MEKKLEELEQLIYNDFLTLRLQFEKDYAKYLAEKNILISHEFKKNLLGIMLRSEDYNSDLSKRINKLYFTNFLDVLTLIYGFTMKPNFSKLARIFNVNNFVKIDNFDDLVKKFPYYEVKERVRHNFNRLAFYLQGEFAQADYYCGLALNDRFFLLANEAVKKFDLEDTTFYVKQKQFSQFSKYPARINYKPKNYNFSICQFAPNYNLECHTDIYDKTDYTNEEMILGKFITISANENISWCQAGNEIMRNYEPKIHLNCYTKEPLYIGSPVFNLEAKCVGFIEKVMDKGLDRTLDFIPLKYTHFKQYFTDDEITEIVITFQLLSLDKYKKKNEDKFARLSSRLKSFKDIYVREKSGKKFSETKQYIYDNFVICSTKEKQNIIVDLFAEFSKEEIEIIYNVILNDMVSNKYKTSYIIIEAPDYNAKGPEVFNDLSYKINKYLLDDKKYSIITSFKIRDYYYLNRLGLTANFNNKKQIPIKMIGDFYFHKEQENTIIFKQVINTLLAFTGIEQRFLRSYLPAQTLSDALNITKNTRYSLITYITILEVLNLDEYENKEFSDLANLIFVVNRSEKERKNKANDEYKA